MSKAFEEWCDGKYMTLVEKGIARNAWNAMADRAMEVSQDRGCTICGEDVVLVIEKEKV